MLKPMFGDYIKNLRTKSGISSRNLSQRLGKAVTYVSQIERYLIKSPDYETCYRLLELLDVNENRIENILENFDIFSPEKEQAELDVNIQLMETRNEQFNDDPDSYLKDQEELTKWIIEDEQSEANNYNKKIYKSFDLLIQKDVTRARELLHSIGSLTKNKGNFSFLCSLFNHDFTRLNPKKRQELLDLINNFMENN